MANFTVEWLSKSYYEDSEQDEALYPNVQSDVEEFARSQYSPTSPNNSCGYASGSESEIGEGSEGESAQQRRTRTKFTSEQINRLTRAFWKHKYLGATQRRRIAENLRLSETQVKTWFQNRRMKLKREVRDTRPCLITVPAVLLPPFRLQHPFLSGQLPAGGGFFPQQQPHRRTSLPSAPHPLHPAASPYTHFY